MLLLPLFQVRLCFPSGTMTNTAFTITQQQRFSEVDGKYALFLYTSMGLGGFPRKVGSIGLRI